MRLSLGVLRGNDGVSSLAQKNPASDFGDGINFFAPKLFCSEFAAAELIGRAVDMESRRRAEVLDRDGIGGRADFKRD